MSRWPAVVETYTPGAKTCEISIAGLTDGASSHLVAEIELPIGDRGEDTEIRIKTGDRIWVDFLAGDPRYPIMTGFRAREDKNMVGTRHWEHANFTIVADDTVLIKAGKSIKLQVGNSTFELTPAAIAQIAAANSIKGPVTQTGGDMTSDGISAQKHTHTEQGDGAEVSKPH
ncbi:hypothetical protein BJP27_24025 (plasmid) [Pseudomonas oryzihabitans]|nr:hypothetical protein BJP27_24025 [Pseudomonas psychrotolerans]